MVIFSNKKLKSKPKIQLKGELIEQVSSHKHLGVFLSQDMKWTTHIDHSVKKVKKKLGLLRRQSRNLLNRQKIDIYKTIIRPVFEYGSALFDNCSISNSLKLEGCQRTAALICTGAMKRTESKLLMRVLGWESLSDRRKISKLTLFYKITQNGSPSYLFRCLPPPSDPQAYNLRGRNTSIKPIKCRLVAYKGSFFPDCISIWNKLPNSTKNAVNIVSFKKEIYQHFKIENRTQNFTPFNHFHDGFFGKFLTQIKLKLSPLNAQLFEYNLTENPFCAACGDSIETPLHFFTECTSYEPYRQPLFRNLLILNPNLSTSIDFLNYILIGSTTENRGQRIRENETIFRNLSIYMYRTERFIPK